MANVQSVIATFALRPKCGYVTNAALATIRTSVSFVAAKGSLMPSTALNVLGLKKIVMDARRL